VTRLPSLMLVVAMTALADRPAAAQIFGSGIVYDPANHAQNVLQAVRALQQIEHQVRQLGHEIQMLENMARDLKSLPENVAAAAIGNRISRLDQLMRQARGVGFDVGSITREYERLYPETYGESPPGGAALVEASLERWRQSRDAYRDTLMTLSAALEDNAGDVGAIGDLLGRSQAAAGNLEVLQAGNQLGALQAEQLIQMEAMMAAQYRAEALERSRDLAEAERGRARTQAFLGNR
jgi:P-type conjugative transfer protein TrbJ